MENNIIGVIMIIRNEEIIIRLLIALFMGGLTGLERERSSQFAGFRTHILVSVGSCITAITSLLLFEQYSIYPNISLDPARLTAQVLSGIGFLGAGAILKTSNTIRGLTTAAGIWATACIGIAIGYGYYILGASAWFLVVMTLYILKYMDQMIFKKEKNILKIEVNNMIIVSIIYGKLERSKIEIKDINIEELEEGLWEIRLLIVHDRRVMMEELIKEIKELDYVENSHCI